MPKTVSLTYRRPPKISVVMIAKDEEKNIDKCLASIHGIANEIILVDTGSSDRTNEIAERYRAKIHFHLWEDDFSKARNQSIQYAKGDWLMAIDCDEEAVFADGQDLATLKSWLRRLPKHINAVSVTMKDVQEGRVHVQWNVPKLFRKGKVHYKGIVHNEPIYEGNLAYCPHLFYYHYGYDIPKEQKQKKANKSIALLKKRIDNDKNDYQAYFYLAEMLGWSEELEEANKYAEKYLEHKDKPQFSQAIYFMTVLNYMKLNDLKNADRWLLAGIKSMPDNIDLLYALTEFGIMTNKPELVAKGARNFIKEYPLFKEKQAKRGSHFIYSHTPEVLAFCTYHLAILQIQEGALRLKQVEDQLPKTTEKFEADLRQTIDNALHKVGLQKYRDNTET